MLPTVCVGVAVQAEPVRLIETLAFLRTYTDPDVQVVLLCDGPDDELAGALVGEPDLRSVEQWHSAQRRGMASSFNLLAGGTKTDVVVLLEAGVLVGPRWLELLSAALQRPGCGLAGPSTNRAANEQAAVANARPDDRSVRRDAAEAMRRFGHATRTLEPLYSLSDFCYAVRREVIDAVGAAEEAYGLGPGWERDYNVRATKAGWRGTWVGAAYVYRHPPSGRQLETSDQLRDHSDRLFQDRFCGLRSADPKAPYRPECLGDSCEHFAPTALLPVPAVPLAPPVPQLVVTPAVPAAVIPPSRHQPRQQEQPARPRLEPAGAVLSQAPLVTAIMPTRDRPDFALQAVRYFQRQDYPHKELVIVEDGPAVLGPLLPEDSRIRLVSSHSSRSIGALRNLACQNARGDIVIQWDDDDWHGSSRITRQVTALRSGTADITALRGAMVFDLERWHFWRFTDEAHRRMFVRDVHGGTLAFRRSIWERLARYPDRSLAEDAAFLDQSIRRGARLHPISAEGLFVYLRHGSNSWRLDGSPSPDRVTLPEPELPAADRDYYRARSGSAPKGQPERPQPRVSALMPTYNRRRFVARAIDYFLRQDHVSKELVIVDDGEHSVADLVPDDPSIVYHRLEARLILGAKRNLACELASGTVLVHWDDDDWHAPNRLSAQAKRLLESDSELCGSRSLRFYEPAAARAWRYDWPTSKRSWVAGQTLCYRKDLWERSPFPELATGEDSRFVWSRAVRSTCDMSDVDTVIGIIHRHNTVPKTVHGVNWSSVPAPDVERLLGPDLSFYRSCP